jgi:hypothetical protein
MLPLLVAMQVAQPDPGAAPPQGAPPPPPPAVAPQPYPYPYGYPYGYPYPPPYAPPEATPAKPPRKPVPDRPVHWFARVAVGLGPPGFSEQTSLLRVEGYGGAKFVATLDGGWFFHENVGVGAWSALGLWASSPGESPELTENAYFLGAELPLKLGSRSVSLVLAPRLGWGAGQQEMLGDASFQHTIAFGGDLSVTTFKYHLSGHVGFLRAAVGPPGAAGRDHDYGGLYFLFGGTIDG